MSQVATHVASQVLSLHGERIILPNTAVAEIIPYSRPEELSGSLKKNAPAWLLGMHTWRGISVPVLALEAMFDGSYEQQASRSSIAVINAASSVAGVPFFAIATQGIPRLLQVGADTLSVIEETGDTNKTIACHVVLDGEVAIIPDLDVIESMVSKIFNQTTGSKKKKNKKK